MYSYYCAAPSELQATSATPPLTDLHYPLPLRKNKISAALNKPKEIVQQYVLLFCFLETLHEHFMCSLSLSLSLSCTDWKQEDDDDESESQTLCTQKPDLARLF